LTASIHITIEVDFLDEDTLTAIPDEIDAAYYLIHSMSGSDANYDELEPIRASFLTSDTTKAETGDLFEWYCKRYIVIKTFVLKKKVEEILNTGTFATTTLRAGIIVVQEAPPLILFRFSQ
jgi:hypothetical protein